MPIATPSMLARLLAILMFLVMLGGAASLVLASVDLATRTLSLHLVFAVGILPLILGAMTWFIPALSRSGPPEHYALWPPLLALAGGFLLILGLTGLQYLLPIAALLSLTAGLQLFWWSGRRAHAALGGPHPGLLWYRIALVFLILGLLAILLGLTWPEYRPAFRRLHLHLNLLGFVGLTAVGTWRVLLPTAAGYTDPEASRWLAREWRLLVPGTLLIGAGAAWSPPLAAFGLLFWLLPLLGLVATPLYRHRRFVLRWHGAAPTLAVALFGLITVLLAGALHGFIPAFSPHLSAAFILTFLLPLVTGAATHLLPLWLHQHSGQATQQLIRNRLGRFAALRALIFWGAGAALLAGWEQAWLPALLALLHFVAALVHSLVDAPSTAA